MSQYTIRINGLSELIDRFGMANQVVQFELNLAMFRAVTGELGRMPVYPPPPPNSSYTRTGYLGRSLTAMSGQIPGAASTVEPGVNEIRGIIGTNVSYAQSVIGNNQQPIHRGRWWQLESSVLSHQPEIEDEFSMAAHRVAAHLGD